jgi:hypothetical protein
MNGGPDTITSDEVARAVRAQLGDGAAVTSWRVAELGRGRGDATTSLGVARVGGTAQLGGVSAAWSQIRKVYVPPADVAGIDMGRTVGHWNYWRREPELLASGLLRGLPPGVGAPAAYLVTGNEDAVTVWMEDLGDLAAPTWTRRDLDRVAYGLGRLGGGFAGRAPYAPWLGTDLLGQWVRDLPDMAAPLLGLDSPGWNHPIARGVFPSGAASPVAQLLGQAAGRLPALAVEPVTFCHRDTGLDNILLRRDSDKIVLIDWALAGSGPLGEDLGVLFASAARQAATDPIALCRSLLEPYLTGLRSVQDAPADATAVWRAAITTAALREGIFAAFHISRAIEEPAAGTSLLAGLAQDAAVIEALAAAARTEPEPRPGPTLP